MSRDRGASLVEVGIILPILILLAVGLAEIGFLVVDYMTVSNAAREGARTGAAAADYSDPGPPAVDADDLILEAVEEAACNMTFGSLQTATIYRAEADGSMPLNLNYIRVYNAGVLLCDAPGHGFTCPTCATDWDPANRARLLPAPDSLGVELVFTHSSITGIFPFPSVSWTETAVMTLQPDVSG